jgi:putative nucleotidyltransferase with HDIG domain
MSKSILQRFPQIDKIKDAALREQVIENTALKRGKWRATDLEQIPFSMLAASCGVSLAAHTRNVTDCCIKLGEVLEKAYKPLFQIHSDYLIAGAILHDVGKALEYCSTEAGYGISKSGKLLRHPISGAALAAELGLPDEVVHIIAVHSKEGDGGFRSPEAWIIHHADFVNFEPLRNR